MKGSIVMMNEKVLTRDEMTAEIMKTYDRLDDEGKAELANAVYQICMEREMEEFDLLLGKEPVPDGKTWETFQNFVKYKKANPKFKDPFSNELMLLIDVFNYGRICGRNEAQRE